MTLPYRRNVGAVLFNHLGSVFLGRRSDITDREVWQCPQGGIDAGEEPAVAVLRELREEIGTDDVLILGEHTEWLSYDFPADLPQRDRVARHRGQTQRWFALLLLAGDSAIDLAAHGTPEFDRWRWAELSELATLDVGFKRPVYQRLAVDFAPYAALARLRSCSQSRP